jgi:hypothetical protein
MSKHSPAPWSVTIEGWTAIIRDAQKQFVTSVSIYNNTDEANARLIACAPEMFALLERIVSEEQARYDRSYRAAADTNNMDGVGIHFDYAPYPVLPKWVEEAKRIITKEGEQR